MKTDFTKDLIQELDKELQSIHFPHITFVPTTDKARWKEKVEPKRRPEETHTQNPPGRR